MKERVLPPLTSHRPGGRLRLNYCGRYRWQGGAESDPGWGSGRISSDQTLLFYWAGEGKLLTQGGWVELQTGTCVLLRAGWHYKKQIQNPENPLGMNFFHFDLLDAHGEVIHVQPESFPEQLSAPDPLLVDAIMRRALELLWLAEHSSESSEEGQTEYRSLGTNLFSALLWDLLNYSKRPVESVEKPAERRLKHLVARAALAMEENPTRSADLRAIAKQAGYSTDYFARIFRATTGLTPRHYANRCRIRAAGKLLRNSDCLIKQVAIAMGYENEFYFSRAFKKETGLTPRLWREGKG